MSEIICLIVTVCNHKHFWHPFDHLSYRIHIRRSCRMGWSFIPLPPGCLCLSGTLKWAVSLAFFFLFDDNQAFRKISEIHVYKWKCVSWVDFKAVFYFLTSHCISPSQPTYGSSRQRTVKDWAAAGQPADQPTDPDAKHWGMFDAYTCFLGGPISWVGKS